MSRIIFCALFLALFSCKKGEIKPLVGQGQVPQLPANPFNYEDDTPPPYMVGGVYDFTNTTPSSNPVTNDGATLGRVLFYDRQLSVNNQIACASCHHQENSFSDPAAFSKGWNGGLTTRNSMAILNMSYGFRFFWDLRANGLENQALMPIEHPVEMGMDLALLEEKLADIEYYDQLFTNAFGDNEVTSDRIARALAQFMRSIYSYSSKYDQGVAQNFSNYTVQEEMGRQLFFNDSRTNCNGCHQTHLFSDYSAHNTGLESVYTDEGLAGVTGNPANNGEFKTPTLRNIEFTAPYMHDGRFETLEEVVDFYNSDVQAHPNLDDRLTTTNFLGGPPRQMNLTDQEKLAIVAFLKTLSDENVRTNERWSDPF